VLEVTDAPVVDVILTHEKETSQLTTSKVSMHLDIIFSATVPAELQLQSAQKKYYWKLSKQTSKDGATAASIVGVSDPDYFGVEAELQFPPHWNCNEDSPDCAVSAPAQNCPFNSPECQELKANAILTFITDFIISVVVVVTEGALVLSGEASLPFATAPKAPGYAGPTTMTEQNEMGEWVDVPKNGFVITPAYVVDGNTFDKTDFNFVASQWRLQDDLDDPSYEFGRYKCASIGGANSESKFESPDST
jgi:hypothetical protein